MLSVPCPVKTSPTVILTGQLPQKPPPIYVPVVVYEFALRGELLVSPAATCDQARSGMDVNVQLLPRQFSEDVYKIVVTLPHERRNATDIRYVHPTIALGQFPLEGSWHITS